MIIEDDNGIRDIFQTVKTIAVVGCSPNKGPKNYVPAYLIEQGYTIIPVNPRYDEVLGQRCYPSLLDVPVKVDMVDCFRPAEDILPIAEDAIAIGAKILWMQLGIENREAAERLTAAGIRVVMNRCPCIDIPLLIRGQENSWEDFRKKCNSPGG